MPVMSRSTTARTRLGLALALASVIGLAACSSGGSPAAETTTAERTTAAEETTAAQTTAAEETTSAAPTEVTPITVTLNFLAGGPNVGFMVAKEKGYYDEVGLDVTIQEGQGSGSTASLVAQGNSQFGFADGPSAMAVTAQDGDLVILAPILQTNGFSVMALSDFGLTSVKDLAGHTVALQPGTAQASLFLAVLAANDVAADTVDIVNIDPSALVATLLQGSVDAITAGADTQAVQLRNQGADIDEVWYRDAGVPTIGLSIISQRSYVEANPDLARNFIAATLRGWDDARSDPAAAADIVFKQFPEGFDLASLNDQLDVDLQLVCVDGAEGIGKAPQANWDLTKELLVQYLDLPDTLPIEDYFTTGYLPDELPAC